MTDNAIAKHVYDKRPIFAGIVKKYGDLPFLEYLEQSLPKEPQVDGLRKKEFLGHFEAFLHTWVLPSEVLSIVESFKKTWIACTADHHGIPWDPFFANENLAHAKLMHIRGVSYACVFAASGVSLGNSSLPRSVGFHDASGKLEHVHFFPASLRAHPVYGISAVNLENIKIPNDLQFLKTIQNCETFSKQITHMTHKIWDHVPKDQFARLAYLPLEELTVYLLNCLQNDHPLWTLITAQAKKYCEAVENIQSAHTSNLSHGSMIFWRLTPKGMREPLILTDGTLQNQNADWSIKLEIDEIKKALAKKQIYPTYALCLIIMSCYFGITCTGGFDQVGYLAQIHAAYKKLTGEDPVSHPSIFCGECVIVKTKQGDPATLIDVILENNYAPILKTFINTPLKDLIGPMLPMLAKI